MDNELPLPTPESTPAVEKTFSIKPLLFIIGIVLLIVLLGAAVWFFILSANKSSTPPPSVTIPTSPQVSKNYQSNYLQKNVSIKAPDFLNPESLIIADDRLNGVVVKKATPSNFLVESDHQTIPVSVDSQTVYYLSQASDTPPDGPFSGIKLPGDYSNSIKELHTYTIQFTVISEASDSASFPWVKDTSGSYIAKSVLLFEK